MPRPRRGALNVPFCELAARTRLIGIFSVILLFPPTTFESIEGEVSAQRGWEIERDNAGYELLIASDVALASVVPAIPCNLRSVQRADE